MATRKTRFDDETIIAKYNKSDEAFDASDSAFKAFLPLGLFFMHILIYSHLIDCLSLAHRDSASDLIEIINLLISITDLTFGIMLTLAFIASIFSYFKFFRCIFWTIKFEKLEKERRQ